MHDDDRKKLEKAADENSQNPEIVTELMSNSHMFVLMPSTTMKFDIKWYDTFMKDKQVKDLF